MKYNLYNIFAILAIGWWLVACTDDEQDGSGGNIILSGTIDTRAAVDDYPFWLYAVETGAISWSDLVLNTPNAVLNGNKVTLPQDIVQPFLFKNVDWVGLMREGDMNESSSTLTPVLPDGTIDLEPGEGTDHSYLLACVKNASPKEADLPFKYLMSQVLVTLKLHDDIKLEDGETSLQVEYTLKSPRLHCDLLGNTQTSTVNTIDITSQVDVFKDGDDNTQKAFYLTPTPGTSLFFEDIIINGSDATQYDTEIITEVGKSYTVELTIVRRSVKSAKVELRDWLQGYDIEHPPLYNQIQFAGWPADNDINQSLSQRITRVEFFDDNNQSKIIAGVKKDGTGNMRLEGYNLTHNNIRSLCVYLDGVKVDVDKWVDRTVLPGVIRINKEYIEGNDPYSEKHYLVANRKDLEDITLASEDDTNYYLYYQITDIDLSDKDWTPIGFSGNVPFKGDYNGQGFRIKNMKIDMAPSNYLGLFSQVNGWITNLILESTNISGGSYVGAICGSTDNESSFINIHLTSGSKISGTDNVGGVCGEAITGIFRSCSNASEIYGESCTGGIVGHLKQGTMNQCLNTAKINCNGDDAGGIAGKCVESSFNYCVNRGTIFGEGNNYGGICGRKDDSFGDITGSYNSGDVSPERTLSTAGAIIGFMPFAETVTLENCYWAGNISEGNNSAVGTGHFSNIDSYPFSVISWPDASTDNWGLYLGLNGGHWKSFGRWDGTYPIYPTLWFE